MLMFGSDGWWNDPTDPRNMPSIPASMQGDAHARQQMAIADAESRKPRAGVTQSPFGGSMFGSRFSQFPYMSMGLGSMLGYGSPMMGGYNSYSFRGMPYGGYSQPMMGGMSYGGYGYPMMGGYGPQMMGGYGYPMMGYSGYSSPMMGGYSPYGFSGMMGGLGSLFGSSSGSSGENPYGSPL